MNRVVHFEIFADNVERVIEFYAKLFGWRFEKWVGDGIDYWMVLTAEKGSEEPGINGGLLQRTAKPVDGSGENAFVCTIQVDDFDCTALKIEILGGKTVKPKYAIGDMAWQGYFRDPEGNMFGLHQVIKKE